MKKNMVMADTVIGLLINRTFAEFSTAQIASRFVSLLLILALLVPMFFFGEVQKVSASPIDSPMLAMVEPAPLRAAPEYYNIPGSLNLASIANSPFDLFNWLFSSPDSETDTSESLIAPEPAAILMPPTVAQLSRERLNPKNATGGTNLYSRNFSWGTGLVGLPGRGLDAGFGISYNSLIWTKVGTEMVFNPDANNVTPGFQFGYPIIEPSYTDTTTGLLTFVMVSPSGSRTEFRRVGTTTTYETADSSYTQIVTSGASALTLKTTDGTQMSYSLISGKFRCTQIKDRNGNFITISNNATNGRLQTVTDTLGRVITVNYDAQGQPTTITTPRNGGTYTFATFTYTNQTITTSFTGLTLVGITNGASVKVLQRITYADGSYTTFEYNPYGQVWRINNFAADLHKLNHVSVNLSAPAAGQTDCPRFTETRTYAENFNSGNEVVIPNLYQENQSFTPPGSSPMTGTLVQVTAPDGVISKTYMMGSGWAEGLPLLSEDWTGVTKQRWSSSTYTQDNTGLTYILNPRVTESKIGDATNTRRTTIDYLMQSGSTVISQYGLPAEVKVYDTNQTSILKRSTTTYNLNTAYTTRRIIGLLAETNLFDGANNLLSKVTYQYDEGNFTGAGQTIAPIRWDNTNYGASFIIGRGNLTSTTRWDVTAPTTVAQAVTSSIKYNTAGAPVSATDPLGREVKTAYTDSFDDNINRNTFAYVTSVTDPNNSSSTVKYKFELGANVWAQSPAPAGQTVGKTTSRTYDIHGRLTQETVNNTGAYTRYVYPTNGVQSQVYSTITDVNGNNTADTADEALSESFTDGAGRVRMSRSEHPGSVGGWSGTLTEYDIMGRTKRSTVPTEINSGWAPTGDDAAGWLWNEVEYDWKGRVTRQINTDGTDKLISYAGCGCAGGMLTTIQSELVPRDDQPTVFARRTQKVYEDILGRSYKSETLNWDGSVYATSKTFFNGRDQVTLDRQYAGPDTSPTFQDTNTTYDGHGRLKTQHKPEQNPGTVTTWNYYADDTVSSQVDARGAVINYTYNSRRLVTQVSSTSPDPTNVPVAPTVTYIYDNVGNRTQMTDGLGSQTYQYDQLSRLISETRNFTAIGAYTFNYTYGLGGQLKSLSDPADTLRAVSYNYDKVGRLGSIGGNGFGGVTSYVSNMQHRAWGDLKQMTQGSQVVSQTYNNRLQIAQFQAPAQGFNSTFQYYADGRPSFSADLTNNQFDRSYRYDHMGRMTEAKTSLEARNEGTSAAGLDRPYNQTYGYDAFTHTTSRQSKIWTEDTGIVNTTYINERVQASPGIWEYDADGRETRSNYALLHKYDTKGQTPWTQDLSQRNNRFSPGLVIQQEYDGDGYRLKQQEYTFQPKYYVRSSVLGNEVVYELINNAGPWVKDKVYVYAGGKIVAQQSRYDSGCWDCVQFHFRTPITGDYSAGMAADMLDPMGAPVGFGPPPEENYSFGSEGSESITPRFVDPMNATTGCDWDGIPVSCDMKREIDYIQGKNKETWARQASEASKAKIVVTFEKPAASEPTDSTVLPSGGRGGKTPALALAAKFSSPVKSFATTLGSMISSAGVKDPLGVVDIKMEPDLIDASKSGQQTIAQQMSLKPLQDNPNCIKNAVGTSKLKKAINNLIKPTYKAAYNGHDGIHVNSDEGYYLVYALPGMDGKVLHYGRQDTSGAGARMSVLDIQLNIAINGDPLVLTLKDMGFKDGSYKNGQSVSPKMRLGFVISKGLENIYGEDGAGLHATLMLKSTYDRYIRNGNVDPGFLTEFLDDPIGKKNRPFSATARSAVPTDKLIDAANNPISPFRCP